MLCVLEQYPGFDFSLKIYLTRAGAAGSMNARTLFGEGALMWQHPPVVM